jgi:hypothetical protein
MLIIPQPVIRDILLQILPHGLTLTGLSLIYRLLLAGIFDYDIIRRYG